MIHLIRFYPRTTSLFLIELLAILVLATACSGSSPAEDSDECQAAIEVMQSYDQDPSTPDNVEPRIEDVAAASEATEAAYEACGGTPTGTTPR